MSKRGRQKPEPGNADRLPPHSEEMERGVLGCILLSPAETLPQAMEKFRGLPVFYDLRNAEIFNAMVWMQGNGEAVDSFTLRQHLKDNGELDQVGGDAYLGTLQDDVPSAANLSYYADIVFEKYQLRQVIQTCSHVVSRVYGFEGEVESLLAEVETDLMRLCHQKPKTTAPRTTVDFLMNLNLEDTGEVLIGNDWLERGGSCLMSAASGIGKSVLEIQMAALFALGKPFVGLKVTRPLKSVIIFAENSNRDNARALRGIVEQMGHMDMGLEDDQLELLNRNVVFRECYSANGQEFVRLARQIAIEEKPDLMWLDPIAAYAGDDVGKQTVISDFCRSGLHPIAKDLGFAWFIINHFTKPSGDGAKARKGWTNSDHQYRGAGSYDLTGWSRAGITISEHSNGIFQMRFAKRGIRAGATHPDGSHTEIVWMQHSAKGVYWEQINPPEETAPSDQKGGKPSDKERVASMNLHSFCANCKAEGEGLNQIAKRLESWLAKEGEDISPTTCKRTIPLLVKNKKLLKGDDSLYRKGPNA